MGEKEEEGRVVLTFIGAKEEQVRRMKARACGDALAGVGHGAGWDGGRRGRK